jgi:hypothetical protein
VGACKASLQRVGVEKLALVQLHWSTAKYAPLQERLMWDGLVAIYGEVRCVCMVHEVAGGGSFGRLAKALTGGLIGRVSSRKLFVRVKGRARLLAASGGQPCILCCHAASCRHVSAPLELHAACKLLAFSACLLY